ncbi:hypothetical protein GCM10023210_34880 [Chryseobacterium ginsengisoli]|uniref:Uncharacterized protein n=1 Tax=Chryseobacterium ginsengisoli TaxID=363853 RepID=A0ABP9MRI6_9FLAO
MHNFELTLSGNINVKIESIFQEITYSGVLEGYPCEKLNKMVLNNKESYARRIFNMDEVYLIPPTIKFIDGEEHKVWGKAQELPMVTCIAELKCLDVFRDMKKDYSNLIVIWFQDYYTFPIQEDILEKLLNIPYKEVCGEFDY